MSKNLGPLKKPYSLHGTVILFSDCDYFTIPFGDVNFVGTGYDAVAMVTCHPGYTLWGPATVVCQSNSMWSRKPICDVTGNFVTGNLNLDF